jgi:hypothetical protein
MVETPILKKLGLPGEQQKTHREMFAAKSLRVYWRENDRQ